MGLNQKALHIIKEEKEWKETWSGPNGPAEVTCGEIVFLCGKKLKWVRFPEDKKTSGHSASALSTCIKCSHKREILNRKAEKNLAS